VIWIRIFRTRRQAEEAQKILKDGGFRTAIHEDKLFGIPIQRFGVPARFRLMVERRDFEKVVVFLANRLKER
jgi:hypothetical protein